MQKKHRLTFCCVVVRSQAEVSRIRYRSQASIESPPAIEYAEKKKVLRKNIYSFKVFLIIPMLHLQHQERLQSEKSFPALRNSEKEVRYVLANIKARSET